MAHTEIIHKLAHAADQLDAAGNQAAADLIDLAIKKIAQSGQIIDFPSEGEPTEIPEGYSLSDDVMGGLMSFLGKYDLLSADGLDEVINILQVMRMEIDFDQEPEPEDPYETESAWTAMEKDFDL